MCVCACVCVCMCVYVCVSVFFCARAASVFFADKRERDAVQLGAPPIRVSSIRGVPLDIHIAAAPVPAPGARLQVRVTHAGLVPVPVNVFYALEDLGVQYRLKLDDVVVSLKSATVIVSADRSARWSDDDVRVHVQVGCVYFSFSSCHTSRPLTSFVCAALFYCWQTLVAAISRCGDWVLS